MNPAHSSPSDLTAAILDMDGVLWRLDSPIGDLPEIFAWFERRGLQVMLASNNSTLSAAGFVEKLSRFGVQLGKDQILNSSQTVAHFLRQRFPAGGPVYFLGEAGLEEDLQEQGFYAAEENVLAVVSGLDRNLTYAKLRRAALLIQGGAFFVGTNPDTNLVTPQGLIPGAGAIAGALQITTGVQPVFVGKPAPEMYRLALERMGVRADQTIVIGDRLDTDIAAAQSLGCRTGLVLSGVSTQEEAQNWHPALDWIADDLTHLLGMIESKGFYASS